MKYGHYWIVIELCLYFRLIKVRSIMLFISGGVVLDGAGGLGGSFLGKRGAKGGCGGGGREKEY